MLFGAHVSVAGGYVAAVDYAESVGAECMQIFAKSPRQWQAKPIDVQAAELFVAERAARGFGPIFTHTAYLLNLSTTDEALRERSIAALTDELVRAAVLGAVGVVTHIGNDPGDDSQAAAVRAGLGVRAAFESAGAAADGVRLLLENTAGAGRTFGATFDQIGSCMEAADLPSEKLGCCLDTCHAFAQGMELDSAEGWEHVVAEIRRTVGTDGLGLIHANDCMFERGSKRDRHAWIGDGLIGNEGFSAMVGHPALEGLHVVTEMPGDKPVKDQVNIERLKTLRNACRPSQ